MGCGLMAEVEFFGLDNEKTGVSVDRGWYVSRFQRFAILFHGPT